MNSALERYRRAARSENTIDVYRKSWIELECWCIAKRLSPAEVTAEQAAEWIVDMKTGEGRLSKRPLKIGTIQIYLSGIKDHWKRHMEGDCPFSDQLVADVMAGIIRTEGMDLRQAKPLLADDIRRMIALYPATSKGHRNRSLLTLGFAAALRRTELVSLQHDDIEWQDDGSIRVLIRKSKTDQKGKGYRIPVPDGERLRPVTLLRFHLEESQIKQGPIFRSCRGRQMTGDDLNRLIKLAVGKIGLDPAQYSAHSLRAGFVTEAAKSGARIDKIMEVTRHKSAEMVMRYIRDENSLDQHAGKSFL